MKSSLAADSQNHYHKPDCLQEFWRQGAGKRKSPLQEAFCVTCGKSRGLRTAAYIQSRPHCSACGRATRVWTPRHGTAQIRHCAYSACRRELHVSASKIRTIKTFHCNLAHYHAARHERATTPVRCVVCGEQRGYRTARIPKGVTRETMTWVCPRCRPHKTAVQMLTCAHCGDDFPQRVAVEGTDGPRFCRFAHFQEYHRDRRRLVVCQHCGKTTKRRQGGRFCDRTCYAAWLASQPRPERGPSQAEKNVLRKWRAGVRGVRHLAVAAGVSTTTVLKLKREGKLADAAVPSARPLIVSAS